MRLYAFFGFRFFITAFTSLIRKDFVGVFRMTTVMASECNLLSSSKVISRRLDLKILYSECIGLFLSFLAQLPPYFLRLTGRH